MGKALARPVELKKFIADSCQEAGIVWHLEGIRVFLMSFQAGAMGSLVYRNIGQFDPTWGQNRKLGGQNEQSGEARKRTEML